MLFAPSSVFHKRLWLAAETGSLVVLATRPTRTTLTLGSPVQVTMPIRTSSTHDNRLHCPQNFRRSGYDDTERVYNKQADGTYRWVAFDQKACDTLTGSMNKNLHQMVRDGGGDPSRFCNRSDMAAYVLRHKQLTHVLRKENEREIFCGSSLVYICPPAAGGTSRALGGCRVDGWSFVLRPSTQPRVTKVVVAYGREVVCFLSGPWTQASSSARSDFSLRHLGSRWIAAAWSTDRLGIMKIFTHPKRILPVS
ncbi:hypothetical protein EJ02DRAFT_508131 [Clathrospora elynae]|uniref:Uncharacterized protein n=1 Tax=Clathrospora elynae TaxID=706981 RepID=A0A6A5T649_9PLEO|nr:hypothetical protein EJ02DRAFT_508131 [Clathrospora elynae]